MYIIDKKFKNNSGKYFIQSGLAIATIIGILFFLDVAAHTAIIASLGATVFTVFSRPKHYLSGVRSIFGGYMVGIIIGALFNFLSSCCYPIFDVKTNLMLFGALSVGVAIFFMILTNTEHAPAAGISLGMILNEWNLKTIYFIFGALIFIMLVKEFLKPYMMNLIGEK